MTREIEYNEAITNMLELIWGVGFMTPGGEGNIANMMDGLVTQDRRILDIGCGIGAPALRGPFPLWYPRDLYGSKEA